MGQGAREKGGVRGAREIRGSKGYVKPGFRVPITSVGKRGKGGVEGARGVRAARGMLY